MVSLMQNESKTDNIKTTLELQARVEYANIDREINQSEYGSSLTPV